MKWQFDVCTTLRQSYLRCVVVDSLLVPTRVVVVAMQTNSLSVSTKNNFVFKKNCFFVNLVDPSFKRTFALEELLLDFDF